AVEVRKHGSISTIIALCDSSYICINPPDRASSVLYIFFLNETATTEIYTLSLHDALPISRWRYARTRLSATASATRMLGSRDVRSEEHTSELQSRGHLVCRLLLEKKKIAVARGSALFAALPPAFVAALPAS